MRTKQLVLSVVFLLSTLLITAQKDSLSNVDIDIVKPYKPILAEAVKINYIPTIDPPQMTPAEFRYELKDKEFKTSASFSPAKAAGLGTTTQAKLYGNYTKIGYGNYNTPLFETYLNNTRSSTLNYGLFAKHLSSELASTNQNFSDDHVKGYLRKSLNSEMSLGVDAYYQRNRVNYFGYNPDSITYNSDSIKQVYQLAGGNVEFKRKSKSKFSYSGAVGYYYFKDLYGNTESLFTIGGDLGKVIRGHEANVPLKVTQTSFGDSLKFSRLFVDVNPRYYIKQEKIHFNVGFNSTIYNDTAGGKMYFYPVAEVRFLIIPNVMTIFAGVDGGIAQNTYRSFAQVNPFIDTVNYLKLSQTKYNVFGGFQGAIGKHTGYNFSASYKSIIDMPLFIADTTPLRKYEIVYDAADVLTVHGEVSFQLAEELRVSASANYYTFNLKDQARPWNLPTLDAKLSASYIYDEKLAINLNAIYMNKRYGRVRNDSAEYLMKDIIDLNLGVEYRYNKFIALFLNANNLVGAPYQRWYSYPSYKFNILGGVTFTF